MHRSVVISLTLCTLLVAACGRGATPGPAPVSAPPPRVEIPSAALLYYDNSGGVRDSVRLVIRDAAALQEIWFRATSTQPSPPPVPPVNFATEMVLVVGAGRMTPNDDIRVDSLAFRDEMLAGNRRERVMEAVVHTIRGCQTLRVDAYPLAIMRVPRFDGQVRFIERREGGQGCPGAGRGPSATPAWVTGVR